jgi:glycosyltransferase 2 family protein
VNRYSIAKGAVGLALLAWLGWSGRLDLRPLFSAPWDARHLLGMVVLLASMIVQGLRWWQLLKTQDIRFSFLKTLQLTWIGQFFAAVLPGMAGGELARGYYIFHEVPSARTAGVSTVLVDRALGLYAFLFLGIIALSAQLIGHKGAASPVFDLGLWNLLLFVGVSLVFLALTLRRSRGAVLKLLPSGLRAVLDATLSAYSTRGRAMAICFVLSLLAGIMVIGSFQIASRITHSPLSWEQVVLVCPLVFIAAILPISPGGIGIGETAASLLFARFGVETGATIMLIVRIWILLLRLPGGLLYMFHTPGPAAAQTIREADPPPRREKHPGL